MKTSCLAALALLASAVHAAVPADNFFAQLGLEQPVPARNGNRLSHSLYLNDKEGGVLHFEFDVEHHANLFALDSLEAAAAPVALECSDAGLRLTFADSAAAAAALETGIAEEGAVIAGGRHWGCSSSILRKVVRKTAAAGATVVLETVPASFEDAFNHADITFRTSMFPTSGYSQASAADDDEKLQRRFVADEDSLQSASLVPSYLKKAWSGIKDALVLAEKSMKAIYTTTKAIAKGDVEVAQTLRQDIFNFNYDRSTDHAATVLSPFPEVPAIKCQNCYADFDLEVDFALKIASKKLKRVRTTIGGEASFVAESAGRIDVPLPAKFASFRKQIAEINAPPIVFDVAGVPFIIEFIVPIELGIDLTAEATGYVAAGVGAKGFLRFGFDYQGDWNSAWVVERGFSHFVHKPQLTVESIEAAMTVSLFPNLHVKLEHIGGPTLGLRLFSTVAAATADTLMCPGEPQAVFTNQVEAAAVETQKTPFLVSVDVGTQMLLGAFIDIKVGTTHLLKKEFTPLTVFSIVRRVSESCLAVPLPTINGVVETLPTEAVGYEGRAWYVDRLDCAAAAASAGPAALQMVGPTSVVLALNEEQGPCTGQYLYELANLPAPGSTVVAKRVAKDDLNLVSCRSGSMTLAPPASITIEFGKVFNSIQLSLGSNCVVQMN